MPLIISLSFLTALPIVGIAIFWSSWFGDLNNSVFPAWTSSVTPQVKLSQGLVIGTVLDNKFPAPIDAFMGLPYAQSPTGDRRFRRAFPLPDSNLTFRAQKYGPMYALKVFVVPDRFPC